MKTQDGRHRAHVPIWEGIVTINYYDVLEIDARATAEEIKSSFRRKVMECHPDRNPDDRRQAEERVRIVIEAYRVLADPESRSIHDRQLDAVRAPEPVETIWDRIRRQTDNPAMRSRLVLHELLEGNGREAVAIYESLLRDYADFDLLPYLDLKDYLDCKFLLAEEYERRGNIAVALGMYREVYKEELELPRLCYFFEEVKVRLRDIYCGKAMRRVEPRQALRYYEDALDMDLCRPDKALVYKRMAESHFSLGNLDAARASLEMAFRHHPKLKGTRRICEKLGITPLGDRTAGDGAAAASTRA